LFLKGRRESKVKNNDGQKYEDGGRKEDKGKKIKEKGRCQKE
jgi:hypothetical protein